MAFRDRETNAAYMRKYRQRQKDKREGKAEVTTERKVYIGLRLPESVAARVNRMVHEGKYPWRTPAEFYRVLILKGMEGLRDHDPEEFASLRPILQFRAQLDTIAMARTECQGFVSRMRHEIGELVRMGDRDGAARLYNSAMNTASEMDPTSYRDWMIDELRRRFSQFEKMRPKGIVGTDHRAKAWKEHRKQQGKKK